MSETYNKLYDLITESGLLTERGRDMFVSDATRHAHNKGEIPKVITVDLTLCFGDQARLADPKKAITSLLQRIKETGRLIRVCDFEFDTTQHNQSIEANGWIPMSGRDVLNSCRQSSTQKTMQGELAFLNNQTDLFGDYFDINDTHIRTFQF